MSSGGEGEGGGDMADPLRRFEKKKYGTGKRNAFSCLTLQKNGRARTPCRCSDPPFRENRSGYSLVMVQITPEPLV
jgi:hypothetical protein